MVVLLLRRWHWRRLQDDDDDDGGRGFCKEKPNKNASLMVQLSDLDSLPAERTGPASITA